MRILCSISLGELVDKITILEIKKNKIPEPLKLKNINFELKELKRTLSDLKLKGTERFQRELKKINMKLTITFVLAAKPFFARQLSCFDRRIKYPDILVELL